MLNQQGLSKGQVIIGLGTDTDRDTNMHTALDALHDRFGELQLSAVYASRPVTSAELSVSSLTASAPDYWNAVVAFQCDDDVADIHQCLKSIETDCGRDRQQPRVAMDIDLLFVGDVVGVIDGIELPRPEMDQYAYILRPLSELFPDVTCPGRLQTFHQLWEAVSHHAQLCPVDFVWRQQVVSVAPPCLPM